MADELQRLKEEAKFLRESMKEQRDVSMETATRDVPPLGKVNMRVKKYLRGHIAKVYALHWSSDSKKLVSTGQDGNLLVWNAETGRKRNCISLSSSWVMSCGFSPNGKMICCGGLDATCSVYIKNMHTKDFERGPLLRGHTGYLSCCKFFKNDQILTSSGDKSCILWDVVTAKPAAKFTGHSGDVTSFCLAPDQRTFITGACDCVAKIWDVRTETCCQTFEGHEKDINAITFFPSGSAFITGSDDSTCRLFDIRADQELMTYKSPELECGVTSVAISKSGRILFAGKDEFNCDVWDVLKGNLIGSLDTENSRVSCMGVSPDGSSLVTGSWDNMIRLWSKQAIDSRGKPKD